MTEATERSMLRVMRTSIWATATIMSSAASIESATRFEGLEHARVDHAHRHDDGDHGGDQTDLTPCQQTPDQAGGSRRAPAARPRTRCRRAAFFVLAAVVEIARPGRIDRGLEDALLRRRASFHFSGDPALAQDEDAVTHADQLGQLGGDENDREALAREIGDQRVDLGLGLHVDALRRLVQDQHPGRCRQPLRQHDLLLIAAGEGPDGLVVAAEAQPQPLEVVHAPAPVRACAFTSPADAALSIVGRVALARMPKSITRLWPIRSSDR